MGRGASVLMAGFALACKPAGAPVTVASSAESKGVTTSSRAAAGSEHSPGKFELAACEFDVEIVGELPHVTHAELRQWVADSASAVANYLGAFPVPTMRVVITTSGNRRIGFGQHYEGIRIRIRTGSALRVADMQDDWVMIHEMFHAAFPDLATGHRWMQEGLSTYLEPIARARTGAYPPERVWDRWLGSMHHGVPRRGERGLDHTRTWGSLYWGGALFWLLADVGIREATDNRKSLDDAIRAIVAKGGTGRADWTTQQVIDVADEATGTSVVSGLYDSMARDHLDVDLDDLWRRLGVSESDNGIRFDDSAPLAHIRRGITAGNER